MTTTNANTIAVVWIVSLRVGHDTRPDSCQASWAKAKNSLPGAENHATTAARAEPAEDHQHPVEQRRLGEAIVGDDAGEHAGDGDGDFDFVDHCQVSGIRYQRSGNRRQVTDAATDVPATIAPAFQNFRVRLCLDVHLLPPLSDT